MDKSEYSFLFFQVKRKLKKAEIFFVKYRNILSDKKHYFKLSHWLEKNFNLSFEEKCFGPGI